MIDNQGNTLARYPGPDQSGQQAPEVTLPIDQLEHIEQGLGETETHIQGQKYYLIVAPIKRPAQEGYLHLIVTIPENDISAAVGNALSAAAANMFGR